MPRPPMHRSTLPLLAVLAAVACSDSATVPFPDECNILIAQVTPNGSTLYVNDTLTFHAAYTAGISAACIPNVPASSLRWSSSDTQLASVDSLTGKVTARGVGSVSMMVHTPGGGSALGSAMVTVTAH